MREAIAGRFVGSSVKRVEDRRLLTGHGRYVGDVSPDGVAHAAFLRSTLPHAHVRGIDTSRAEAMPGVLRVLTGADMVELTNPFLSFFFLDGLYTPLYWPLATDRVRMVGDPVAIVVAESRYLAEDAVELIEVDYEPLDPVATMDQAGDPASEPIWPGAGGNVLYEGTDTFGDVDEVFASADRVIREHFVSHRQSNQPMETRGSIAEIDRDAGELIFHSATQSSHVLKWTLAMVTGKQPVWRSIRDLAGQRDKLRRFGAAAKEFATANKAELDKGSANNAVMAKQLLKEPSRIVHLARSMLGLLAKDPSLIPEVQADDIGGAFGVKGAVGREDAALCAAALHLGRSVKWIEDRNEHLTIGGQARDESMDIEVAANDDGEILGFRVNLTIDQGAYPTFPFGAPLFSRVMKTMMPGTYRLKAFQLNTRIVASNKANYVAYRGPWSIETWTRERMLDVVARELGITPAEIRLRNMYGRAELPAKMITGPTLDVRMSARETLERALDVADLPAFEKQKEAARAEGRCLGIGFATFHEAAPGPPDFADTVLPGGGMLGAEPASTVLAADGTVRVLTQQMPHGQGHETTFAQVAADELGVPIESVEVVFGNTRVTPFGIMGTGGSRASSMLGGAVTYSSRDLRRQILDHASTLLEAAVDDLEITDGRVHVRGVPAVTVSLADVAAHAGDPLEGTHHFDGGEGGWSQATHVCWVEVDLDTGFVHIPRYVVVEDCGELINPAIVEGQVRGGVAQGIGAVLYEKAAYDDEAQFQAGTFMDYLIPTSMEIPEIEIHHVETPSDVEANYRGVGEGGMLGAPPAITNAIEDALAHLGVRITEQHLPPTRILELAGVIPPSF